jgi:hypothetical protein
MSSVTDERVIVLDDWPQPEVVAEARIRADEHAPLVVRYRTADERVAVIRFPLCIYVVFGAPNDEALGGHPLSPLGLRAYAVHEVKNSSLVRMLEQRNAVHPRHDRAIYLKDKKHYVFTFQDSTLECVVNEGKGRKPQITVVATEDEAERAWRSGDA